MQLAFEQYSSECVGSGIGRKRICVFKDRFWSTFLFIFSSIATNSCVNVATYFQQFIIHFIVLMSRIILQRYVNHGRRQRRRWVGVWRQWLVADCFPNYLFYKRIKNPEFLRENFLIMPQMYQTNLNNSRGGFEKKVAWKISLWIVILTLMSLHWEFSVAIPSRSSLHCALAAVSRI